MSGWLLLLFGSAVGVVRGGWWRRRLHCSCWRRGHGCCLPLCACVHEMGNVIANQVKRSEDRNHAALIGTAAAGGL